MDWSIRWAYVHAPAWIRGAVDWLVQFIMGLIGIITSSLTGNRSGWIALYRAYTQFRSGLARFAVAVPATLAWLRNYWVPLLVRLTRDALITFIQLVESAVRFAFRAADAIIDRAWRAATALLSKVVDALARWAREAVNAIWRAIPIEIRRAWLLLLNPIRLAEWAASAIFFALLRLAEREAEQIGRWLLANGNRFTLTMSRILVRVIERIL